MDSRPIYFPPEPEKGRLAKLWDDFTLWLYDTKYGKKLFDAYYSVDNFFHFLGKVYQYSKLLWKDFDWDWPFILILLSYKLKRTRECLNNNGFIVPAERAKLTKEIKLVEKLLDRVINKDYSDILCKPLRLKHGDMFYKNKAPHIQKIWIESMYAEERMRKRELKWAFNIMHKYMFEWWD